MSPHFFAHIIYILESTEHIERFLLESSDDLEDHKTYLAVIHLLQTLSESATKLPDDIKQSYPAVKWQQVSRMRNVIVHDYLGGSGPQDVLKFIKTELPVLQATMQQQLPQWKELRARFMADEESSDDPPSL